MKEITSTELEQAYWLWLRSYQVQSKSINCGSLRAARKSLLLTLKGVAEKAGLSSQGLRSLEVSEDRGLARLKSLERVAAAMDCEFLYFFVPRTNADGPPKDFSHVVWDRIWPEAIQNPRVLNASPKLRSRALAAAAKELLKLKSKRL